MRAAVMRGGRLVVDDVPDPEPGPGELLVRSVACGICGSDLHALKHGEQFAAAWGDDSDRALDLSRDVVMGHEFCVEVLEAGPQVEGRFATGDLLCSVPSTRHDGRVLSVGYSNDVPGGYAERLLVSEALALPVPNGLDAQRAALTEPMAVGWHAVARANLAPDDVPLVIGCGPVGLAVIAALKVHGVGPIIAADFSPRRRALAETMGADIVLDPATTSPYTRFAELAAVTRDGRRVPENPLSGEPMLRPGVFFECVGVPGVIDQLLVGAQRGCRFVIVGVCMQADQLRPMLAILKEINMQFVLAYTPEEFADTLRRIADGTLPVDPLITGTVGVDGVPQAFEDLADPEAHAKILVEPWR